MTALLYTSMVYGFLILSKREDKDTGRILRASALGMFAILALTGFTYERNVWLISLIIARIGFAALIVALILNSREDGVLGLAKSLLRRLGFGTAENLVGRSNNQGTQREIADRIPVAGWNNRGMQPGTTVEAITDGETTDEMSKTKTDDAKVEGDAAKTKAHKEGAIDMEQEGGEQAERLWTDRPPYCLDAGQTERAMTSQFSPDTAGERSVILSVECKEPHMNTLTKETARELRGRLAALGTQMVCVVVDAAFLTLWLVVQWVMDSVVLPHFRLSGFHNRLILVYQILFAIATVAPIVAYVVVDLLSIFLKAKRAMKEKMNHG